MSNLQTFPHNSTLELAESDAVINQVQAALRTENHPIAQGIMSCIKHHTPAWKIIKDIKELIREDYSTMDRLLGVSLVTEIENL